MHTRKFIHLLTMVRVRTCKTKIFQILRYNVGRKPAHFYSIFLAGCWCLFAVDHGGSLPQFVQDIFFTFRLQ